MATRDPANAFAFRPLARGEAGADARFSVRRAARSAARIRASAAAILAASGIGCSSVLTHKDAGKIERNQEFEQAVSISEWSAAPAAGEAPGAYVRLPSPMGPYARPPGEAASAAGKGRKKKAKGKSGEAAPPAAVEAEGRPSTSGAAASAQGAAGDQATGGAGDLGQAKAAVVADAKAGDAKKKSKRKGKAASADASADGAKAEPAAPAKRQPELEDAEGFAGRRPVSDPYRVGEKVTLELSYFGVVAGDLEMELKGFANVNGRKAYKFGARATSRSVFSMVYAVDDWAETFVDYETMTPSTYALHVKESKQLREQRMYFDWPKLQAHWWDKRVTKDWGVEEKKMDWAVEPFAQTIFSGPFYLRAFQLTPGKKLAFRVANEGKNYVFTGEVLRRETIRVPAGEFKCVVVKPTIQLDGLFQPMGEILFWLTDDDRKFFVRIESKIKIGTIVGVAREIQRGEP